MTRFTIDLSSDIDDRLTDIAARAGITKAEAMRRGFALLALADEEKQKGKGFSLGIVRENVNHELEAVGRVVGV
jgi:Ribbon-helix-helix protein, copG family